VSQTGDLWLLGKHRLLCGDSTVATDVERVLGGVAPHLMVTDPPYLSRQQASRSFPQASPSSASGSFPAAPRFPQPERALTAARAAESEIAAAPTSAGVVQPHSLMLAAMAATWASVWVRAFLAYGISRSIDHRSTLSAGHGL
jgi:hypothetical protein